MVPALKQEPIINSSLLTAPCLRIPTRWPNIGSVVGEGQRPPAENQARMFETVPSDYDPDTRTIRPIWDHLPSGITSGVQMN